MDDERRRSVFVGNMAPQTSEEILHELFIQVGPVERVSIPKPKGGNGAATYAFVTFRHEESAVYATNVLRGSALFGRNLNVKLRDGPQQQQSPAGDHLRPPHQQYHQRHESPHHQRHESPHHQRRESPHHQRQDSQNYNKRHSGPPYHQSSYNEYNEEAEESYEDQALEQEDGRRPPRRPRRSQDDFRQHRQRPQPYHQPQHQSHHGQQRRRQRW